MTIDQGGIYVTTPNTLTLAAQAVDHVPPGAPRPYYQEPGIAIYHGDCRAVVPQLRRRFDGVVTDPPFGTGWARGGRRIHEFMAQHSQPSWDIWSTEWLACVSARVITFFCPHSRQAEIEPWVDSWLRWTKTNPRPLGPPDELIAVKGMDVRGAFAAYNGDTPWHPCQKPQSVMSWIIQLLQITDLIDLFMGSGTTLCAAKSLGIEAVGIDTDERYCEIAVNRLRQGVFSFEERTDAHADDCSSDPHLSRPSHR
jgi:site-specific DNA-methyltransferase (adenine-specific)